MSEKLIKLLKIFKSDVEFTFSVIQLGILAILVVPFAVIITQQKNTQNFLDLENF